MAKKINKTKNIILYLIAAVIIFSASISIFSDSSLMFWQDVFNYISPTKEVIAYSEEGRELTEEKMSVHIIDVGKADSIYINSGDKNILVDAGDIDTSNKVLEYLKKRDVKKLDLVVVSHPHKDHIGGMRDIINEIQIERFMMPEVPDDIIPTGKTYESMLLALDKNNIKVDKPICGDSFKIGDMELNILSPSKQYDKLNNNSIVIKLKYGSKSFLLTGDAEKEAENDIIKSGYDLKSDVLKVGHHGSKTSSTQNFLNAVSPKYAAISVGENNKNLPRYSVVSRIEQSNIKIFRTDINGDIVFVTDGNNIDVKVEKE